MGSSKRGGSKRGSSKRGSSKRGSYRKNHFSNRNNIKRGSSKRGSSKRGSSNRGSLKRKKRVTGGGFMDNIKTSVGSIFSKVSQYFKPKDTYSIESFEGNFNTLFD